MKNYPKPIPIKIGFWICVFILFSLGAKSQTSSITVSPVNGNFCAPAPIKLTAVFSTTPIDFIWDYGVLTDEDDRNPNPTITYLVPGTYKITLTALFQNTLVTAVENITIYGLPIINILPDRDYICQPGNITFSATSTQPVASYSWNFDDGSPAVAQPSGMITHTFNAFRSYNVSATATTAQGCSNQTTIPVSLSKPSANLINSPKNGCLPANVLLQANVLVPAGSTVSNYSWNFGDGSPMLSNTINQVTHTYTNESGGRPTLNITTSEGCTNTFSFDTLFFGNPPQPVVMSIDKSTICFSESGVFRAYSVGANAYKWDFGPNNSLITTDTLVFYKFADINNYNVSVTPYFNGCQNVSESLNINVVGVKAGFGFNNRCTNKNIFDFYPSNLANVTNYVWDFGDGSPKSNMAYPTHTFPGIGNYTNTLIVRDSITNCRDTSFRIAYVAIPKLIPTDSFSCINNPVTLRVENANYGPDVSFNFTLLGKNFLEYGPSYNFKTLPADNAGFYNNRVIVIAPSICPDTLIQAYPIRVGGPIPNFDRPTIMCVSSDMVVQNTSATFFPYDPIVNWLWDFGNGTNTDTKANPTPFKYSRSGRYWVTLQTTDSKGCIDSIRKQTVVNHIPFVAVYPSSSLICPGDTVLLNALHQGKIRWSPTTALSCDTCSTIYANPLIATIYTATASDTIGCSSSFTVNIDVHKPYTFNHNLRDTGFCIGGSTQLDVGVNNLLYNWSPANGLSNPNIRNPIASPTSNTIYRVDVIDSAGCFPNTAQANVLVHPLPLIDPGPTIIVPYNSPFMLRPTYGPDIVSYKWNPLNQLNCSTCANPTGIALESYKYTVTATTSKGCTASDTLQLFIDCSADNILMPTAFTPNSDNLNDYFYPITRGMDKVNKFIIYNRYGQVVFQRYHFNPNDQNSGWNGAINGNLPASGNYLYVLEAVCNLGEVVNKNGSVMLIR
jgi:gliding motility-associated-like protein